MHISFVGICTLQTYVFIDFSTTKIIVATFISDVLEIFFILIVTITNTRGFYLALERFH